MQGEQALFIAFGCLAICFCWAQWFWARQTQKLIDKLMSRNYHEYEQALNPPAPKAPLDFKLEEPNRDIDTLNSLLTR